MRVSRAVNQFTDAHAESWDYSIYQIKLIADNKLETRLYSIAKLTIFYPYAS